MSVGTAPRRLGDGDLEAMTNAVADMEAALDRHDPAAWGLADERFHRALLELGGNRRLASLAYTMWDQVHRARLATVRLRPLPFRSNTEHRALLAAVRRGDEKRARELHRRHRLRTADLIIRLL